MRLRNTLTYPRSHRQVLVKTKTETQSLDLLFTSRYNSGQDNYGQESFTEAVSVSCLYFQHPPSFSTAVHLSCISYSVHTSFSLSCVQLTHQAGVLKVSMNCGLLKDFGLEGPSLSSLWAVRQ